MNIISNNNINEKQIIKIPPKYYHCFKINETNYAIFDIKMDMPLIIGSFSIIKSINLPQNSFVFNYKLNSKLFFEKLPDIYIKIKGEGTYHKAPQRYHKIDNKKFIYHHFKLSSVLSVIFDDEFDMPISYGSNQKIQAVINSIDKSSTIFYYKEDLSFKNSFKLYMTYKGKI